jgi:hypothetical protein
MVQKPRLSEGQLESAKGSLFLRTLGGVSCSFEDVEPRVILVDSMLNQNLPQDASGNHCDNFNYGLALECVAPLTSQRITNQIEFLSQPNRIQQL